MAGILNVPLRKTLIEPEWRVVGRKPPSDFGPMERRQAEQYYDMRQRGGASGEHREFLIDPDGKVVRSEAEKAEN